MSNITREEVEQLIADLQSQISDTYTTNDNATLIWILLCGFLVFWMHAGFCMLEAGSVRHKNAINIMFKNICTVSIGGVMYYLLGFAFAYGTDNIDKANYNFIGSGGYALKNANNEVRNTWFFQFAFAATAATIVSGAVAGRVNLWVYFLCASFLTAFVYPVVTHWVWASGGWISAFAPDVPVNGETWTPFLSDSGGCGMVDYAGSGVVHLTGGVAAFWGAFIMGPRMGRFDADGKPVPMPPHNIGMQTLGVFILWFGWYGFNCGSTLAFDGENASKVAVTTTLSPSMAVVTGLFFSYFVYGHFDIGTVLNCALGGLVSITAGCSVVPDWAALIIGFIGAFVYILSSMLMKAVKVDDPVDAIAVHGFCGIWGCLAVGIFAETQFLDVAYGGCDWKGNSTGIQFATQLIGVLAILGWVTLMMVPFFFSFRLLGILRVPPEMEETGLDLSEHGGQQATVGDEPKKHTPIKTDPPATNEGTSQADIEAEVVKQ